MTDNSTDSKVQATDKGHAGPGEGGTGSGTEVAYSGSAACSAPQSQTDHLMERIVHRDNLNDAYRRVVSNKGAAGVDGMSVHDLLEWCRKHRDVLIGSLLEGTYTPSPVRGVEIPKANGGKRQLGIPTAVDRLVQQAFLQILTPILDPLFYFSGVKEHIRSFSRGRPRCSMRFNLRRSASARASTSGACSFSLRID